MAHLSPIHEWNSMSPCEVFASKFGAMLPSLSRGYSSATAARARRMTGEVEERGGEAGEGARRGASEERCYCSCGRGSLRFSDTDRWWLRRKREKLL